MRREGYFICIALFSLFTLRINVVSAKAAQSRAPGLELPSSCGTECGGITFQYPFGIGGKECYFNEWYEVVCKKSNGKEVPFLPKINSQVVKFSFPISYYEPGFLHIRSPVISSGCSSVQGPKSPLNVTGSPFYITPKNSLVAVGCNTKASITDYKSHFAGCESSCGGQESQGARGSICSGYRCCQARLPVDLPQVMGVKIESNDGTNTTGGGCSVAFLTNKAYSPSNITEPELIHAKGYMEAELAWLFDTSDPRYTQPSSCISYIDGELQNTSASCYCEYSYTSEPGYGYCGCDSGFTGNPYVSSGCIDIDECQEDIGRNTCGRDTCVNIPGSFRCDAKNTRPMVLGTSLGLGLLVLVIGMWGLYKFIRKQRRMMRKKKFFKRNGGLLLQQQLVTTAGNVEKTRIFSSKELEKATDNFNKNRVLGQGGQGTVYKGMLADGRIVAVKKSKLVDEDKVEEFLNEIVVLSQINHRNVVKILGCCLETEVPLLVYEFIPNGDLLKHLRGQFDEYSLTWEVRLCIATEIAGAVSYLHSAASFPIYHRDIKSNNILLDEKYRAKVSDFGTSRSVTIDQTHLTTVVAGTFGYVDPEYFRSGQFTDKSDVYSFGVVLVELITGERPVSIVRSEETRGLATHFIDAMKENRLLDIVDARIKEDCKPEQVVAVAKLARRCLSLKGKKRPSMREVSLELERIRSSPDDSEVHIQDGEEEDEDEATEINGGRGSWSVDVIDAPPLTFTTLSPSLDAEPLVPHQMFDDGHVVLR